MNQDDTGVENGDRAALEKLQALNTVGTISYVLHLIVAMNKGLPMEISA